MVMKIYPIFLPFSGCPFRCIYCDQGVNTLRKPINNHEKIIAEVSERVESYRQVVLKNKAPGEIAFYGGTFTALPKATLEAIVEILQPALKDGIFSGVRCSTRPDALSDEAIDILACLPMSTIELGVQTLNDRLLTILGRGYSVNVVEEAVQKIRSYGWQVGLQLMVGVPDETQDLFLETINRAVALSPDVVRLYPLLVLPNTILAKWYRSGRFSPISLKDAILWCAEALMMFEDAGISVIRIGLQSNPALDGGTVLAGPYHPAFGYFVRVHKWRKIIDRELEKLAGHRRSFILKVPKRYFDECRGPRQINVRYWIRRRNLAKLIVEASNDLEGMSRNRTYSLKLLPYEV